MPSSLPDAYFVMEQKITNLLLLKSKRREISRVFATKIRTSGKRFL